MKISLSLHIDELTKTKVEQVLIPFLLGFSHRASYNNCPIDWDFNISCANFKLNQETPFKQENVNLAGTYDE